MTTWNQTNNSQRSFLMLRAKWRDVVCPHTGKVTRREPLNYAAEKIVALRALDRDVVERRNAEAQASMDAAVKAFDGRVKVGAPKAARGSGYLQRKTATALPMQYFRAGGSFA
jgi:hypothetical protein